MALEFSLLTMQNLTMINSDVALNSGSMNGFFRLVHRLEWHASIPTVHECWRIKASAPKKAIHRAGLIRSFEVRSAHPAKSTEGPSLLSRTSVKTNLQKAISMFLSIPGSETFVASDKSKC
ncbi:hypothetical protein [uncultured Ruegeria sp.]|uniref:hypothetical protein n=1 Tax=uncultured Ruegeria sp. TaxID=259304 RepID=UPI00260C6C4C|nr:hypothetical protein [uncultured Ruegeria sp.]